MEYFIGALLLVVLIILAIWAIGVYNNLLSYYQSVKSALSRIDTELNERFSILGNMVEFVKGYCGHEANTIIKTIEARSGIFGRNSKNVVDASQKMSVLSDGAVRIMNLTEQYPDLKADQRFDKLENQLITLERDISTAREFYNSAVQQFIIQRNRFPTILIASFMFPLPGYFEASEDKRQEFKSDFSNLHKE